MNDGAGVILYLYCRKRTVPSVISMKMTRLPNGHGASGLSPALGSPDAAGALDGAFAGQLQISWAAIPLLSESGLLRRDSQRPRAPLCDPKRPSLLLLVRLEPHVRFIRRT